MSPKCSKMTSASVFIPKAAAQPSRLPLNGEHPSVRTPSRAGGLPREVIGPGPRRLTCLEIRSLT